MRLPQDATGGQLFLPLGQQGFRGHNQGTPACVLCTYVFLSSHVHVVVFMQKA